MIITIANQKGGVGKTTTATTLSAGLHLKGYKTLLIDTDPQANASDTYNLPTDKDEQLTIFDVFTNKAPVKDVIIHAKQGDVIPGDIRMSVADMQFTQQGREYILRKAITPIQNMYDYIIIDTPPQLGIITINALTASHEVVIPMLADRYSLKGMEQLYDTINTVKEYSNPHLKIGGILITRFNGRTVLNRDTKLTIEGIAELLSTKLFETTIRQSISIGEAQSQQQSIFGYSPNSTTTIDYMKWIDEVTAATSSKNI